MGFEVVVANPQRARRKKRLNMEPFTYYRPAEAAEPTSPGVESLARQANRDLARSNLSIRRQVAQLDVLNGFAQGLLDAIDTGVVAVDADTRIVKMNHAAEMMLGVEEAGVRGLPYHALPVGMNPPPPLADAIGKNEVPPPVRRILKREDGEQLLVESAIALLRDGRGAVIGGVHILKDLSPVAELEKRLRRNAQLALIGKMAAGLAHEIRNPLAAIEGFGYLLIQDMAPSDPRRKFAQNILAAVKDLDETVTSTLVLARAPQLTVRRIAPIRLLEEVKELVDHEIVTKGFDDIETRVEADPAGDAFRQADGSVRVPDIAVDHHQVKRALLNLAKNALDAMPEGGRLTFRTSRPPTDRAEKPMLRLSVMDTGSGLAQEIRDTIFEPFETTKEDGIGLGLAIVKRVVELHGGKISAESSPGRGTAFHLDLPLTPSRESAAS